MVVQVLNSASPPTHNLSIPTKLDLSSSPEQSTINSTSERNRRFSIHRCTPIRSPTALCQPIMEATKALAQKWKRKSSSLSLRRTSTLKSTKENKDPKAAADEARTEAERNSVLLQQATRRDNSEKDAQPITAPVSLPTSPPIIVLPPSINLEPSSNSSPGSDVSPGTQASQPANGNANLDKLPASPATDYFTLSQLTGRPTPGSAPPNRISFSIPNKEDEAANGRVRPEPSESQDGSDVAVSSATLSTPESVDDAATDAGRRLSFLSFNSGRTRGSISSRRRDSSPPVDPNPRFRKHVNFSNVDLGEPTKNNFPCYTQIVRHLEYAAIRRSRTFMVGIDDHQYSMEALHWLFDNFVDNGDEIVCVKVLEKDVKIFEGERRLKEFQKEANIEVERIKATCGDRAVSIVLEFGVGKLHSTFQRLIQLHQPSMLIVGTRGRTLGGFQGFINSKHSFSKYCLQYSPVPVVVVRPDEKRQKKKGKRDTDPEKQSYRQMLQSNEGTHEADIDDLSAWEIESKLSADEEAGKVARALGLPAKFDPTLKRYNPTRQRSTLSVSTNLGEDIEPGPLVAEGVTPTASAANSEDEGDASGDEDEGEFEVESGAKLVQSQDKEIQAQLAAEHEEQKKKDRLHKMEMGEGAALLKNKPTELESDEDADVEEQTPIEDDDEDDEDGGVPAKTSSAE